MMSKKPGITLCVSINETWVSMIHLLKRSRANTAAAIPRALTRGSAMTFVIQHRLRAGCANRWDCAVGADVGRVLPAALALAAHGALHFHRHFAGRIGLVQRHLRN